MSEVHPKETELARFSDEQPSASVADHLRWCARCRSGVADYQWLGGEIEATLKAAADEVPVPRPRWWAVQARLRAGQQRRAAGWRASAFASIALVISFVLCVPNVACPVVAAPVPPPKAATVPPSVTAFVSGAHRVALATPTPAIPQGGEKPLLTPAFALPPTPPDPE
jgi:hypothetical protein